MKKLIVFFIICVLVTILLDASTILFLYLAPTIAAIILFVVCKPLCNIDVSLEEVQSIFVINFLLGWTIVGWLICATWVILRVLPRNNFPE